MSRKQLWVTRRLAARNKRPSRGLCTAPGCSGQAAGRWWGGKERAGRVVPAFDAGVPVPRCPWQKQGQTQSPGHPGEDFFPLCVWFSTTKKLMSNISSQGPWLLRESHLPDSRNCQIINYSFPTLNTSQWYTCQPGSAGAAIIL